MQAELRYEVYGRYREFYEINTREILIKRFGETTGTSASDTERVWEIQGRYREEWGRYNKIHENMGRFADIFYTGESGHGLVLS
jgi:hypothetical protein